MDKAIAVLRGAKEFADLIPVPGVGQAIEVTLRIAELVEDVKASKTACRALAARVTEELQAIYEELDSCRTAVDGDVAGARVEELLSVLHDIEALMERQAKKSWLKRALHREDISEEIANLSQKLDNAVSRFKTKALIRVDRRTAAMMEKQLQEMEIDERFRGQVVNDFKELKGLVAKGSDQFLLRAVDIELEVTFSDDDEARDDLAHETLPVVRYQGKLRKHGGSQAVLVKRYQKKDGDFLSEVEHLKKLWHPNILPFKGYSPDADFTFLAFDLACHVGSFEALSRATQGVDKVLWVINATKQICAAFYHLGSKLPDLQWTPDDDIDPIMGGSDLIVTSDSRVLLDVSRCNLKRLPNLVILYEWVNPAVTYGCSCVD
ncbi:hypothetical protein OH77DRAFT_931376 [Trametes cingulata]|nr:hypothetical protein OH77DRAFT_931376 [Trametes cingulata]